MCGNTDGVVSDSTSAIDVSAFVVGDHLNTDILQMILIVARSATPARSGGPLTLIIAVVIEGRQPDFLNVAREGNSVDPEECNIVIQVTRVVMWVLMDIV